MVSTQQDTVELIRAESERVRKYINGLSQDVLELPTPCEKWTVGDLIAHLVWFAETYGGMMERGLRGDLSPPKGFPKTGTLRGGSGELYALAAINRRKDLGPELLPALNEQYDWLNTMLSGIGPDDWEKPCYHTSRLRPVESFLPTIIQELAVHEWDIRFSLGSATPVSAESLPVLMEKIPLGRPATNSRPWRTPFPTGPGRADSLRYRFDLSGPGGLKFDLVVEGDEPRLEPAVRGPGNLQLYGDTSTFVLILYNRMTLNSAISEGSFTTDGDLNLLADIDAWLSAH